MKIGDIEIDHHFFVQETSSHTVILGEPYITEARRETKVLDNGSAYARVNARTGIIRPSSSQYDRTTSETANPSVARIERIFTEGCQGMGLR